MAMKRLRSQDPTRADKAFLAGTDHEILKAVEKTLRALGPSPELEALLDLRNGARRRLAQQTHATRRA